MQRLLMSLVLIIMFLIAALVAAPLFVDLDSYKQGLTSTIKTVTGLDSEINGTVNVSFFPRPIVEVTNVSVANVDGAASAHLISVSNITVEPSVKSLLAGKVDIRSIRLIDPVLELETMKEGASSWKLLTDKFRERSLSADFNFPDNIIIENGTISFREKNKKKNIDYIFARVNADSFSGPFEMQGNFSNNENIIKFEGEIGEFVEGAESKFNLTSDSINIKMAGNYKTGENPGIEGKIEGETSNLANFVKLFFDSGSMFTRIKSNENMSITGNFTISDRTASFSDLAIISESVEGTTSVDALLSEKGDSLQWDVQLDIKKVDFDKLLEEEKKDNTGEIDYYATSLRTTSISDYKFDISQSLNALFRMAIDEIKYNEQKITNVNIDIDIFNGKATINNFSADLPGQSSAKFIGNVEHNGIRPLLKGAVKASGASLRTVVWWLFDAMSFIPPGEMGEYLFNCELEMTPQKIDLTGIRLSVDKSLLTGDIITHPARTVPVVKADIKIDRMNLDNYGMTKAINDKAMQFVKNAPDGSLESSWLKMMNKKIDLTLSAQEITYNGHMVDNLIASLAIQRGIFAMQQFILKSDITSLDSTLYINLLSDQPNIELDIKSSGFDTAFFLKEEKETMPKKHEWSEEPFNLLGIERFDGKAKFAFQKFKHDDLLLEKVMLEGVLDQEVFTISKAGAELFGGKMAVKGSVGVSEKTPSFGISVVMSNVNAGNFVKVFSDDIETGGKIYFSGAAKTFGGNMARWIREFSLDGNFAGRNILIKNFDLNEIINNSRRLYSVIDMDAVVKKAMVEGKTEFDSIEGKVSSARAVLSLKDFKLITRMSRGVFAGNINMLNGDLKGVAKIGFRPETNKNIALAINMQGSITEIQRSLDTSQLDSYITSKGR